MVVSGCLGVPFDFAQGGLSTRSASALLAEDDNQLKKLQGKVKVFVRCGQRMSFLRYG
jgi:hypothetical protein